MIKNQIVYFYSFIKRAIMIIRNIEYRNIEYRKNRDLNWI